MSTPKQNRLNLIGAIILTAGFIVGGIVYFSGTSKNTDANDIESLMETKKAYRNVEMYNGKLGLVSNNISSLMEKWQHPKPIGITIMAVSCLAAFCTFVLAYSWREPDL